MANPDFIAIPWAVFTDARLTWQAKALYGRLKLYAGRDGACWPSQSTLAREMQMSDRNVRRTIMELSLVGWISIVRRRTTARYLIHATPVINAVSDRTDLSGQEWTDLSGPYKRIIIKRSSKRKHNQARACPEAKTFVYVLG